MLQSHSAGFVAFKGQGKMNFGKRHSAERPDRNVGRFKAGSTGRRELHQ